MTNISSFTDSGMGALLVAPLLCPFAPVYAHAQPQVREIGYAQTTTTGTKVFEDAYFVPEQVDYLSDAIGTHGCARLANFAELNEGWDGGSGSPLNEASVRAAKRFFADKRLTPTKAGVFMSVEGNLVISWEDSNGDLVELEFEPDRVTGFIQGADAEIDAAYAKRDEQAHLDKLLETHIA